MTRSPGQKSKSETHALAIQYNIMFIINIIVINILHAIKHKILVIKIRVIF